MAVQKLPLDFWDTDVYSVSPLVVKIPWLVGTDDEAAADLAAVLDAGEVVTNPVCRLWRMKAVGEPAHVEQPTHVIGAATVVGTVVKQRLSGLEPGRDYRLQIDFGAAGNRRGKTLAIEGIELGAA